MVELVCLGEMLIEMFPSEMGKKLSEVSTLIPKPGGAPANVAIAARRLGRQSAFIGKVGDDPFGHVLESVLRREGVEIQGLRFDPQVRTTLAIIAMPDDHTTDFVFYRNPGADMMLRADELDETLLRSARILHFGSLSIMHEPSRTATMRAIAIAESTGALTSFDVNYRPNLWHDPDEARVRITTLLPFANLVKVNKAELALLSGTSDLESGSQTLLDYGPNLCLVTLGDGGSFFKMESGSGHVPAFSIRAVDPTGSGDAFVGGVLARFLEHPHWRDSLTSEFLHETLRYGNAVGALAAAGQGAIPALPDAHSVEMFLKEYAA